MNPTIPAELLELNTRFETWRMSRKYVREPIPDELWNAAADTAIAPMFVDFGMLESHFLGVSHFLFSGRSQTRFVAIEKAGD